jgi:hypothetical protein
MGTGISNLKFWEDKPALFGDKKEGADDSIYLSYSVFLGLSLLGGFLALDHLYLRSPVTFLAKIIVNIFCFGVWYWFDALQAIWNSDVIKLYGLSVPLFGPKGIGAGVLAKEKPSKLHLNFLIYSMCLLFGGLFGLDSFLVGDNRSGLIRIISLISIIGVPLAIGWWCYNLFWYFTDTEHVINMNGAYFGREGGSFASAVLGLVPAVFQPLVETATEPITATMNAVDSSIQLAQSSITELPKVVSALEGIVNASTQMAAVSPLSALATNQALGQSLNEHKGKGMSGGSIGDSDLNALPYTLLGTVAFISIAGFAATYYRSKKNVKPEADDSPPEPGVLRKPHQEESTGTA